MVGLGQWGGDAILIPENQEAETPGGAIDPAGIIHQQCRPTTAADIAAFAAEELAATIREVSAAENMKDRVNNAYRPLNREITPPFFRVQLALSPRTPSGCDGNTAPALNEIVWIRRAAPPRQRLHNSSFGQHQVIPRKAPNHPLEGTNSDGS